MRTTQVPLGLGNFAEVTVSIDAEPGVPAGLTHVLTARDRFVVHNTTSRAVCWREAPPRIGKGTEPHFRCATANPLVVLSPGASSTSTTLMWRGHDPRRLMQLRLAGDLYEWCCAFSPFESGTFTLKFRPNLQVGRARSPSDTFGPPSASDPF